MGERRYYTDIRHLAPGLTKLHAIYEVSAGGAVSGLTGNGISSVTRLATGRHQLTLSDKYAALRAISVRFGSAGGCAAQAQIRQEDVTGDKTVEIGFYNFASPAGLVDPYSTTIYVEFTLDNTAGLS